MNALRSSVRGFFAYLHRSGRLASDPARVVRMARTGSSVPQPLKPAEAEQLRKTLATATTKADRRDQALFSFLLATGARLSSALAMQVSDLDLDSGEARLRELKGGGTLTVYLDANLVQLLRRELDDRSDGPVFGSSTGKRLTARHAQRRFEHWRDRAGLPKRYSPHSLRHTFATRLYERTGDILVVKEALGHKAIGSTMVYARASADRVRAAVLG
jgi:site-specific recombinase XerC